MFDCRFGKLGQKVTAASFFFFLCFLSEVICFEWSWLIAQSKHMVNLLFAELEQPRLLQIIECNFLEEVTIPHLVFITKMRYQMFYDLRETTR